MQNYADILIPQGATVTLDGGFGSATSYSYPGGLDLKPISVPPVIIK